jgi:gamma-glutamyltranspeptidase
MLAGRFGTMGFDRLFADAIRYGEEGYPVHARVGTHWQSMSRIWPPTRAGDCIA